MSAEKPMHGIMHAHICMTCAGVYRHVAMRAYEYVRTHIHVYAHNYAAWMCHVSIINGRTDVHTRVHRHIYVQVHAHPDPHTHTHVCTHAYTHAYAYAYAHV